MRSARAQQAGPLEPAPNYFVWVTPDGATTAQHLPNTGGYSETFTVQNVGNKPDTYFISCLASSNVICTGTSATTVSLGNGASTTVTAYYNVGVPGTGRLTLWAASDSADDGGYYDVPVVPLAPIVTIVAPVLSSGSRALVRTRQPLVRAVLAPNGWPLDTTRTVLTWRGETVTSLARANRGLVEWEVDSTRWLAVGDSTNVAVTACTQGGPCSTVTRWAVLLADDKPVLGFSGMPLEALGRQFSAPFGPGLSVSGAEVETGLASVPYFSMGAARSAGLVYSTRQSYPRVLVPVDLELTWPAGTPDQITLTLFDGVTQLDALIVSSPTCATGPSRRCRAVLQGDFSASSFATPTRKWLTVEARVTSGQTTQIGTDSVEVVLVDRRTTLYGSGWWPAGVAKLVPAGSDRLLIGPSGTAAVYRGNGDSLYIAPPGDFTVLVKTGSGWELSPRGSLAKLVFDATGRLIKSVDQNGNRDSIAYSGASDQVTSLIDPMGKTITFGYDGNGKLSTITDPGSRQSKLSISATTNQLTYDSLSSPSTRPYRTTYVYATYPGTNTVVLTKRIGVITDTTIVTYDSTFRRRPSQARLPQVQDENGSSVNPVITYTAYERRGYGALVSLDSVYVEMKDPRYNWTRSLLNRWGEARRTWDSLGVVGRAEYTSEGFVLWTEGKVADSSRVYNTYDGLRRLARSYLVRAVGDTMLLDSLVYDANHRVIKRFDSRRKASQFSYDANGNLTTSTTPGNDVTQFWYRADGLLDSTRLPGLRASRKFAYDATWKNPRRVTDESNTVVDTVVFDGLGRDTAHASKIRVQVTATTTAWQWRRIETYFNQANQVDSTRLLRGDNCTDSCAQPNWSALLDTLHAQRVGYRFDRAGRDSLRLNDRGKAVLYLYDRLGRLVSRRPWTDSTAVKDSFVYDVAGNLKKSITRRGNVLTTDYDSRNRDTLTAIPGVGTLHKIFGGPLDQLTRLWYDSPVDSIGGVNGEVRWAYDRRGRLRADTSYTGSIARATSYSYDAYERLSAMTDPLGTWLTRYETNRGYADTLLTPFADTVSYRFDAQSRPVGPVIRGGGTTQSRVQSWTATGELAQLSHSVGPNYTVLQYEREPAAEPTGPALGPQWTEQDGAGAPIDTLRDSVTYDAWERVTTWVTTRNSIESVRDSFWFDRAGSLRSWHRGCRQCPPEAGAEVYDATTDRLLQRTTASGTWSYTYDRAGNLIQATLGATTWTYGYDALNRLVSARSNSTLIARYSYDVLGRRIAKRVYSSGTGGTVAYTRFVYHGAHVAFETDSAGTVGLQYTWGLGTDDLLALHEAAGTHTYVVQDQLHSVRGLVQRDGTWIASRRYEPYGSAPPSGVRYGWTGREYDAETGWYYFRARYYDPDGRRFVQEDPIGYAGGVNVYAYAGGGPFEARDPTGLTASRHIGERPEPAGGGGEWGGGWDPWGQETDFFGGIEGDRHRYDGASSIQVEWFDANGYAHLVSMYTTDAQDREAYLSGKVDKRMVVTVARAADAVGFDHFTVTSFTSGIHECRCHANGTAMDIGMLGNVGLRNLAGNLPNLEAVTLFVGTLMADPTVPVGSKLWAPFIGVSKEAGGWGRDESYYSGGPALNGYFAWHTYLHPHIHFQWGTP